MSQDYNEDNVAILPSAFKDLLRMQIKNHNPTMVKGPPGIGKTDMIKQVCKEMGISLIMFHPVVSDPTDFKGFPFIGPDGIARFVPFAELKMLVDAKKPTVAFLDDLGQAPPSVQAACMQLILGGQINGIKIPDLVTFLAATNRKQDNANVTGILEPVKSRFTTIVELKTSMKDWVQWANQAGLPHEMIAFIRLKPKMLSDFKATANMTNSPSPRTIHNAAKLFSAGVCNNPALEFPALAGAAGAGFAAEFIGFRKIYKDLPDPDHIIMSPNVAKVPTEPSALYAVCGAVAARANPSNMANVVTYANRIPSDFSMVMIIDTLDRAPDCAQTPAFIKWAAEHSDFVC